MENFTITYIFEFPDKVKNVFKAVINKRTLELQIPESQENPEWSRLERHQCSNCTLKKQDYRYCPVAVNIVPIIVAFKDRLSHEEVKVTVDCERRTYFKETTLQQGLSSLIGLYMPTNRCTVMNKLKAMVVTHLPFSGVDETIFRALSMYMLAQYFMVRKGKAKDYEFEGLVKIYDDIRIVNKAFCERLRDVYMQDAGVNAVVILNNFANFVPFSINVEMLENVQNYFDSYLR